MSNFPWAPARLAAVIAVAAAPWLAAPALAQDDPVVARVNGAEIKKSDLAAAQANLPEQYRQMPLDLLYEPLLDQLINGRLLLDEATEAKVADDPEYQRQLGLTRDQLAREFVLRAEVDRAITDEVLRKRYEDYLAANPPEDQVRASHILVATEDEAKAIATELAGGADFTALATAKSTDPSAAQNGGDLGFFKKADMVPEFSEAAFALEPNQTSGPVQTAFGWHIIRVAERRTAEPPAFEAIAGQLRDQMAGEVVATYVQSLQVGAVIERFNLDGTPRAEPVAQ